MKISVIIPAHNEELYITECLQSVKVAAASLSDTVEIIVCLNRCTDGTEAIAKKFGSVIVIEEARNLSKIRNSGARATTGEIAVMIDGDAKIYRWRNSN